MKTARRVLQNSLLNFVSGVSQRVGQAILFILIARALTADATGAYKLAISYTTILLALSLWGLDQLLVRDVAKAPEAAGRYLSSFLQLRLLLAVALWLGLFLLMPALPYPAESKRLILIIALTIIPESISNLYQSIWIAFENVKPVTVINLAFGVLRVAGGATALWLGESLPAVAAMLVLLSIAEMTTYILIGRRLGGIGFRWGVDLSFYAQSLKAATPLIVVSIMLIVEYQLDVVILSLFHSQDEVGIYGTASTVVALLLFLPQSYRLAIFPVLARAYHTSLHQLQRVYGWSIQLLALGALLVAGVVSLLADEMVLLIFGEGYAQAGPILSVLVWVLLFAALNVSNSRMFIVADKQRPMMLFAFLSMSASLIFSLILVPRFGGQGSAWARLLAMPFYTVPAYLYVQQHICPINWRALWQGESVEQTP